MNRGSFRSILGTSILGALVQSESLKLIKKIYLILKLWGAALIGWWLKKGVSYFKVTGIIYRKFESFYGMRQASDETSDSELPFFDKVVIYGFMTTLWP